MKVIKYLFVILFCFSATLSYSQVESAFNESTLSPDSILVAKKFWLDQLDQFKQKVKDNPKDEKAWMQYSSGLQVLKGISLLENMKTTEGIPAPSEEIQKEIDEMLEAMKQNIPNTATYAILRNLNMRRGEERMPMEDIMDKWPDAVMHYPTYMAAVQDDEKRLKALCVRWYESGEFPVEMLNFAYNELASADKDAIIFISGGIDLYGIRMIQNAKDMFKDKKVIAYPFLRINIDELTEELGIPKYEEKKSESTKYSSPQNIVGSYSRSLRGCIDHIVQHTKRPVYFTVTMDEVLKSIYKDSLHSEGLLMRYSAKPYDNLAMMRRNFENIYLMDYLRETFFPETMASTAFDYSLKEFLNLYYIPAFKALLQFYKESGDLNHYDKLYSLMNSILENSKSYSKEVREKYLKSITL